MRNVPSPLVNSYMAYAIVDIFLARFTMSLSSVDSPFHLSVSASISFVSTFISSPLLAIFSCSSVSSCEEGFSGLDVVPCFCAMNRIVNPTYNTQTKTNAERVLQHLRPVAANSNTRCDPVSRAPPPPR